MKVLRIAAENFKNLRVIDIRPNAEGLTKISGANGAGKTNVLDLIFYGLKGRKTLPKNLLRKGSTRGAMRLELDGYTVLRELDEKGGNLTIKTGSNTLIADPVAWLEERTGKLGFDPFEFMHLKPEEQFIVIRDLMPLEENIEELEARNATDEDTKLRIRAQRRDVKRNLETIQVVEELPAETYDINALMEELNQADEFNRDLEEQSRGRDRVRSDRDQLIKAIEDRTQRIAQLRAELERLEKANATNEQALGEANKLIGDWKPLPAKKDRSTIDNRIREASATNNAIIANAAKRKNRDELLKTLDGIDRQDTDLEAAIRARKLRIVDVVAKAKFPIEGLSFETLEEGSGGRERKNPKKVVTYNGIPLADASTAEQIRVSVAIGMATNPDVKLLLIREGSLIDEHGMAILTEMARENGFQYVLEVVDTSGKVGIYLEDGTVKAVNADEPATAPARERKPRTKKESTSK